jgi:hypothetical protein
LDQINRDLAAKRLKELDYWAWYEGLDEWVPLHAVPGVVVPGAAAGRAAASSAPPTESPEPEPASVEAAPEPAAAPMPAPSEADAPAETRDAPPSLREQLSSGLPFAALEQVFILTTGDGQAGSRSAVTSGMLQAVVGEDLETIRQSISRNAIGSCDFLERLRGGGSLPDVAWRALSNLKPELVQQARAGAFRVCIRTFPIETGDVVALILFYNKEKI